MDTATRKDSREKSCVMYSGSLTAGFMNGSSDSTGPLADQIGNRKTNILKENSTTTTVTPPPHKPCLRLILSNLCQVSNSQPHQPPDHTDGERAATER
ncbi:hypothetical protein QQF64_014185 [Cirrhinus molitorella]|uniref:Uncharacterized protein n=1 Tax=Cirrhinus molitorella TaxID=172907 RepID=A0ABR3LWR1_9TELE